MPKRPHSADDPPKRPPTFVCEVPRPSEPCPGTDAARPPGGRPPGPRHLSGSGAPTRAAGARVQSLPARQNAAPRRSREEGALPGGAHPARLFGVRAARLRPAVRALLAGGAPGQPDHPDAGDSGLPRRQSAARGEGPPGPARGADTSSTPSRARRRPAAPAGAGTRVEWKGLELQALLDPKDPVQAHGLACPIKYVRLVRRKLGERNRFSAQLVCQGTPYQKPQHHLGSGIVGLDLGPSAIAVASLQAALLQPFCPEVAPDAKALRRLDRKLDRQRRANNPAHYDERGRVKRGKQRWKVSKRQRKVQARRREVHRKLAATRKRSHGQLAHRVLALGNAFQLEHLSYRAWQKTYGKSVQLCAPGMFVERLSRLAVSAGGTIVLINAWRARLSQTCHCGRSQEESPLPALAGLSLWRQRAAGSLLGLSGTLRSSRDVPAGRWVRRMQPGRGGSPPVPPAYEQAISNQPGVWQASACRLWSASGRAERDAGRLRKGCAVGPESAEV